MNQDDYRVWKSKIVSKATELAYTENKLWSNVLRGNCLPVSLLVIDEVRKSFPKAKVVIGNVVEVRNKSLPNSIKNDIVNFSSNTDLAFKPDFHAWIKIDNTKFLDIVGPSWFEINEPYFDENTQLEHNIFHREIIHTNTEVDKFYKRLVKGQKAKWSNT